MLDKKWDFGWQIIYQIVCVGLKPTPSWTSVFEETTPRICEYLLWKAVVRKQINVAPVRSGLEGDDGGRILVGGTPNLSPFPPQKKIHS